MYIFAHTICMLLASDLPKQELIISNWDCFFRCTLHINQKDPPKMQLTGDMGVRWGDKSCREVKLTKRKSNVVM